MTYLITDADVVFLSRRHLRLWQEHADTRKSMFVLIQLTVGLKSTDMYTIHSFQRRKIIRNTTIVHIIITDYGQQADELRYDE